MNEANLILSTGPVKTFLVETSQSNVTNLQEVS